MKSIPHFVIALVYLTLARYGCCIQRSAEGCIGQPCAESLGPDTKTIRKYPQRRSLATLLLAVTPTNAFKAFSPRAPVSACDPATIFSHPVKWGVFSHSGTRVPLMTVSSQEDIIEQPPGRALPPLPNTLEASIAAKVVLEHGRLQPLDAATGAVMNDASMEQIQPDWREPLDAALQLWLELPSLIPNLSLISIYARGAIPRGLALTGISDVDTVGFAVIGRGAHKASSAISSWRAGSLERELSFVRRFPHVAGLEMRLIEVQEASQIGQWLLADDDRYRSLALLDDGHLHTLDAFRLASQGVLLHGRDLVSRFPLPLPKTRLMFALRADLLKAACKVGGGQSRVAPTRGMSPAQQLTVARWAGKRALRSGMELVASSKKFQFFSRDVLPCYRAIAEHLGEPAARHALIVLQLTCMPCDDIEKRGGPRAVALELLDAAERLHDELESDFLASHFMTPLTSFAQLPKCPPLQSPRQPSGLALLKALQTALDAKRTAELLVQRSAALLLGKGTSADLEDEADLMSDPVLQLSLSETGPQGSSRRVLELDWQTTGHTRQRIEGLVRRTLASGKRPVLLRGAAAELAPPGPAQWNLRTLPSLIENGEVRVSPDATFTFCKDGHELCKSGIFPRPSRLIKMSGDEFVERITSSTASKRPPIFWKRSERYYMQADIPPSLLDDTRVPQLWRELGVAQAQPMRLWISTHGATTPLHFDAAESFLAQMRGDKRIVFFPPSALSGLYPYPVDHPLHRRSRVPLHGSVDARREAFPLFESVSAQAQEVLLTEGDVIMFPRHWWHSVETVSALSCSVGCRYI